LGEAQRRISREASARSIPDLPSKAAHRVARPSKEKRVITAKGRRSTPSKENDPAKWKIAGQRCEARDARSECPAIESGKVTSG